MPRPEAFQDWMIRREGKSQNTAYQYRLAIDRLSENYSENIERRTNIFQIDDILVLRGISTDYAIGGRYQDMGQYGNGTNRNAIAAYLRFFEQEGHNIPFENVDNDNNIVNFIQDAEEINNFTYERDLKTSLIRQIPELFPEYTIYGNNREGIEFPIDGRRIDLLLENVQENRLLIIELKSGIADDSVFTQISWYMGSLMQRFPDKIINGIIIAGEIDDSLRRACAITDRIRTMKYNMNITLEEI
jgi:hypothetical protein